MQMKKLAFLALLCLLYYIAAMYESPALMAIFLSQLLLLPVMLILSFYLKDHFSVSFSECLTFAETGKNAEIKISMEDTARIPVSRFKARLTVLGEEPEEIWRRTVPGSCVRGKDTLYYEERAEHCGIYQVQIRWLKIYDPLALFSRKKAVESNMEIVAFPPLINMKMDFEATGQKGEEQYQTEWFLRGNNYDEIRQIREYRAGDPLRHIHWNQTARTGKPWVKEYEEDPKGQIVLYLDINEMDKKEPDEKDQFYTLLYAILHGMLNADRSILVLWNEKEKSRMCHREVRDDRGCRELFLMLYRNQKMIAGRRYANPETEKENLMRLTDELSWYEGKRLIFQFSQENMIQELAEIAFHQRQ